MRTDYELRLGKWFLSNVKVTPDWHFEWLGPKTPAGYGRTTFERKPVMAHRVSYELFRGPIAPGLTVDHLCMKVWCVQPMHLEAVTQRVNILRGGCASAVNARKTHCNQGHPFDEENTYTWTSADGREHRHCRTCNSRRQIAWMRARNG